MIDNELSKRLKVTDGFIWMICLDDNCKKADVFGFKTLKPNEFGICDIKKHIYQALEHSADLSITFSQIGHIITKTLMSFEIDEADIGNEFLEKALYDVIMKRNLMVA